MSTICAAIVAGAGLPDAAIAVDSGPRMPRVQALASSGFVCMSTLFDVLCISGWKFGRGPCGTVCIVLSGIVRSDLGSSLLI